MELERRFIFNGSAAAYGGRLVRPEDVVLTARGGSALSVVGGRSVWRDTNIRLGKSFRIRSAETSAEGLFDSLRDAVRVTRKQLEVDRLSATTTVRARCRGVEVGGARPLQAGDEPEPLMTVSDVAVTLLSRSAGPGFESLVTIPEASISTVGFESPVHGRFRLDVVTDVAPFKRCDTRPKIVGEKSILQAHGDLDYVFCTVVRELVWQKGREYPGSRPLGTNGVYIPNLGRFYFGELLVRTGTRRLTMIRMELGSSTGGSGSVGDVDTNGTWA
ncbi:MAG: hypothetical protein IT180_09265 [Acidobacteria bacterium]|nr:hypothetical protein [Acidobacteriota bacterium]